MLALRRYSLNSGIVLAFGTRAEVGWSGYVARTGKKSSLSRTTPRFCMILNERSAPDCSTFQTILSSIPLRMASMAFFRSFVFRRPSLSLSKSFEMTRSRFPTIPSPSRSKLISGMNSLLRFPYKSVSVRFGLVFSFFCHQVGILASSFAKFLELKPSFFAISLADTSLLNPL